MSIDFKVNHAVTTDQLIVSVRPSHHVRYSQLPVMQRIGKRFGFGCSFSADTLQPSLRIDACAVRVLQTGLGSECPLYGHNVEIIGKRTFLPHGGDAKKRKCISRACRIDGVRLRLAVNLTTCV